MVLIEVDEAKGIYRCKLCGKEFKSFYELDSHMMFGHRVEVENEFNELYNLPTISEEEAKKYVKKSETILEHEDVRNVYKEGPYVLVINKDTVLRGNSWKELFEAYIKYLYQTYKDFASVDKNLYKMFDDLFKEFKLDTDFWREFFIQMGEKSGITVKEPQRFKNVLEILKKLNFIEDYYREKK